MLEVAHNLHAYVHQRFAATLRERERERERERAERSPMGGFLLLRTEAKGWR
jgi:hypothetical protein